MNFTEKMCLVSIIFLVHGMDKSLTNIMGFICVGVWVSIEVVRATVILVNIFKKEAI